MWWVSGKEGLYEAQLLRTVYGVGARGKEASRPAQRGNGGLWECGRRLGAGSSGCPGGERPNLQREGTQTALGGRRIAPAHWPCAHPQRLPHSSHSSRWAGSMARPPFDPLLANGDIDPRPPTVQRSGPADGGASLAAAASAPPEPADVGGPPSVDRPSSRRLRCVTWQSCD